MLSMNPMSRYRHPETSLIVFLVKHNAALPESSMPREELPSAPSMGRETECLCNHEQLTHDLLLPWETGGTLHWLPLFLFCLEKYRPSRKFIWSSSPVTQVIPKTLTYIPSPFRRHILYYWFKFSKRKKSA